MTCQTTQEATRATLNFDATISCNIIAIERIATVSLAAFNLTLSEPAQASDHGLTLIAGPIGVQIALPTETGPQTIEITVDRLRDSEALHPGANTAILAEIMSLLAEDMGGDSISWGDTGLTIDAARFVGSFTPLRRRGGTTRISPRRVRTDDRSGTPIQFREKPAKPAPGTEFDTSALKAVFAEDAPEQTEDKDKIVYLGAWAATATVGVMNPMIGVPLAAYNMRRGADLRVSTHAFALTAALTGVFSTSVGYLPFF